MEISIFIVLSALFCIFVALLIIGLIMSRVSNNQNDTEGVENTLDVYNSNISRNNYEKEWKHGDFS